MESLWYTPELLQDEDDEDVQNIHNFGISIPKAAIYQAWNQTKGSRLRTIFVSYNGSTFFPSENNASWVNNRL